MGILKTKVKCCIAGCKTNAVAFLHAEPLCSKHRTDVMQEKILPPPKGVVVK